ncbi:hypothetical protein AB0M39_38015 [Streptomyces sp. NPDC051907]|uniref:hypothetical protein n=1 Tax=Streptomyces sp. NPDC051907 TaxID=3155284 RepID=UPI00344A4FED
MNSIFGEPWDAPVCEGAPRVPTPVGEPCLWCEVPVEDGDQGQMQLLVRADGTAKLVPFHRECLIRSVVGPPAHFWGECSCHGGPHQQPQTPAERRAEARESMRLWTLASTVATPGIPPA